MQNDLVAPLPDDSLDRWLAEEPLPADPVPILKGWLDEAFSSREQANPHAVALATIDPDGRPSVRMVLVNEIDVSLGTFVMYTNRESRKGRAIAANPRASIVFHFGPSGRSARVEGAVTLTPDDACDAYFATRPVDAQLGAWASAQSEPLESRAALIAEIEVQAERFGASLSQRGDTAIPRPSHWGGFTLCADSIELWKSRPARIHDRAEWRRADPSENGDGAWQVTRLQP